ncbi:MAG: phosphatase PAP2 family protein [Lachnospiraceae bacterium]
MMGKKERGIIYGIGLVLLIVFTFTDLQISQAIGTKNLYGRIFEVIGELPFVFLTTLATVLLFRFRSRKHPAGSILLGTLYGALTAFITFMGGFMTTNYLKENLQKELPVFLPVLIALLLLVGAVLLAMQVKEENAKEAVRYAAVALVYFLAVLIVMNLLKMLWGRMRFREMADPAVQFTRWYVITNRGGFDNVYASFPSGHTMNSAAVILLTLLPSFLPKLKGKENLLKGISYAWILIVGSSRVVMGAHFASDVTVGALLSLTLFDIISSMIKPKKVS